MRRGTVALLSAIASSFGSCVLADTDSTGATPLHPDTPAITNVAWDCSIEDASWSLDVRTRNWTANGKLWLSTEASYVEDHPVHSVEAASDGSSDHLQLSLAVVADWRDAAAGSSTAFQCNTSTEAALNARLVVYVPGSGNVGDCRSWGPQPTFFDAVEDVPSCDLIWDSDTGR